MNKINNKNNSNVKSQPMKLVFDNEIAKKRGFLHAFLSFALKIPIEGSKYALYINDWNLEENTISIFFAPSNKPIKLNTKDLAIIYSLHDDKESTLVPFENDIKRRFLNYHLIKKTAKELEKENLKNKNNKIDVGQYKDVKIIISQHGGKKEVPYKIILDKNSNMSKLNSLYISDMGFYGRRNIIDLYNKLQEISNKTDTICLFSLARNDIMNRLVENYTFGKYPEFKLNNNLKDQTIPSFIKDLFYKQQYFNNNLAFVNYNTYETLRNKEKEEIDNRIKEIYGKIPHSLFCHKNLSLSNIQHIENFFNLHKNFLFDHDKDINTYFSNFKTLLSEQNGYKRFCEQLNKSINNTNFNNDCLDKIIIDIRKQKEKIFISPINYVKDVNANNSSSNEEIVSQRYAVLLYLLICNKIGRKVLSILFEYANKDLSKYTDISFDKYKLNHLFTNLQISIPRYMTLEKDITDRQGDYMKDRFNDYYWFFKGKMYAIPHICVEKRRNSIEFYREILKYIDTISVFQITEKKSYDKQTKKRVYKPNLNGSFGDHMSLEPLDETSKQEIKQNIEEIIKQLEQDQKTAIVLYQKTAKKYPAIRQFKKEAMCIIRKGVRNTDDIWKEVTLETNNPTLYWKAVMKERQTKTRSRKADYQKCFGEKGWVKSTNTKPTKAINTNFGIGIK